MLAMASASYSSRGSSPSPGLPMGVVRPRAITFHASGSEIYAQGEKSGSLYRIESGAVRIYRLLTDGRRQVVAFHVQGKRSVLRRGGVGASTPRRSCQPD